MKDYEGLKRPFIMIIAYILMSYIEFMNGEGLTNEFIDIDNYYGYTLSIIIIFFVEPYLSQCRLNNGFRIL